MGIVTYIIASKTDIQCLNYMDLVDGKVISDTTDYSLMHCREFEFHDDEGCLMS